MSLNGNLNKSQFMEELQKKAEHINDVLEKFLPAEEGQQRIIFEAMNYSVSRISFNCCVAAKSRLAVGSSSRKISVSITHADKMEMSCRSPLDNS